MERVIMVYVDDEDEKRPLLGSQTPHPSSTGGQVQSAPVSQLTANLVLHAVKKATFYPRGWLVLTGIIILNMCVIIPLLVFFLSTKTAGEITPEPAPLISTHDEIIKRVDEVVDSIVGCREIVGMNLAVIHDTHVLMARGYGHASMETQGMVTNQTLFSIASLTKAFTTSLLAQVLEDSGLTWDTHVRDVLGEDFYFNDELLTNQSTLRDLAAHTMGIPAHNFARFQGLSREELAQKIRFFTPTRDHRTSFLYNNLMYALLSLVTEKLTGESWEELVREKLFHPLGMTDTTFIHQLDLSRPDIATPYLPFDEEMRAVSLELHKEWGALGGSGSIMSTAEDMAHWIKFHLNGGQLEDGSRLITKEKIEETHKGVYVIPQTKATLMYKKPHIPVTYDHGKYGLGWRDGYYRGFRMLVHTGTSWGYGAMLTLLPEMRIGIYSSVTGPDDGYYGRRLAHIYIMDELLGVTPWLNKTTVCTYPEPWEGAMDKAADSTKQSPTSGELSTMNISQTQGSMDVIELESYTGMYGNFGYGNISVVIVDENLHIEYGDLGRWMLIPVIGQEFLGVGQELVWSVNITKILFEFDGKTSAQHVIFPLETKDPPVFIRGLKMSDAPPPPQPVTCATTTHSTLLPSERTTVSVASGRGDATMNIHRLILLIIMYLVQ